MFEEIKILRQIKMDNNRIALETGISEDKIIQIKLGELYPTQREKQKIYQLIDYRNRDIRQALSMPILVGHKRKLIKVVLAILFVCFASALLTGFGYQPVWLFLLVLFLGLFLTLPACFNDYWIINKSGLTIDSFSKYEFIKVGQLLGLIAMDVKNIPYETIRNVEIKYIKKTRFGPFDIQPDTFELVLNLRNDDEIVLEIDDKLQERLNQVVEFLNQQQIEVYDKQKVLGTLLQGDNLFEHFHSQNQPSSTGQD